MWFLRRMARFSWILKKQIETVLRETDTTRSLLNRIRKRKATFFDHVRTETSYDKRNNRIRGKQNEKIFDGLTKRLKVRLMASGKVKILKPYKIMDLFL